MVPGGRRAEEERMRTDTINAGRTAAVAVGAILATGCGAGTEPADPVAATASAASSSSSSSSSSSASVPFGQKAVRTDLRAAVAAAGLTGGKVVAGLGVPQRPQTRADTGKGRKAAALATRLTPCVVSYHSPDAADPANTPADAPADARRQLKVVLSGLVARGWKESTPPQEEPVGDNGTSFMASYAKKGWHLYARHVAAPSLDRMTVMATEEACFGRLTDEERALIEG
ncbi:hypothetical protein ACFYW9_01215 [Streptomyces sp. NPDC002698]|uniref:hypothetical protein n=1 Tax=Streptomyces sp. NPDC002698 TaxID=3364660 RepID=UPI00367A102D